jgi:hypothetical protein
MRFVAAKSEQQQAAGLVFRTRDLLVRQRTQLINAIRGHLTGYGWTAPKGPSHLAMLAELLEEEEISSLPGAARAMFRLMLDLLAGLDGKIANLDNEIAACSRGRSIAQADDRSWHRPDLCHRDRRSSAAGRDLCEGPRLRCLARSHASSKIDRWQTEAWGDIQNGRTHAQAPTHHRQQRRRASGEQTRRPKGFVARTDAGAQTAHASDSLIRRISEVTIQNSKDPNEQKLITDGTFVEAVLHEVAHAVFDPLRVPIWGRQNDAPDRVAAPIMMQFSDQVAFTAIIVQYYLLSIRT